MVAGRRDRALEFLYYDELCHYNVDFSLNPGPSAQPRRSQRAETAHHLAALSATPGEDPLYLVNEHLNLTPLEPYWPVAEEAD